MFRGLVAAGRPIFLSVEGQPDVRVITKGGYGNSKRVGHDITASWTSMASLVDIGAGLWPFAHNATDPALGGWFNDLGARGRARMRRVAEEGSALGGRSSLSLRVCASADDLPLHPSQSLADMLEIGRGEFAGLAGLPAARAHYSL